MKAALVGMPASGKSTLFSAITGVAPDPYAPPELRQAVVPVPDPRLAYLVDLYKPKKVIEATLEVVDVPGCVLDDAKGQAEWKRVLPAVRQADLLVVVVRDFENDAVAAYKDRVDPDADFVAMWDEFLFADLDAVTTRIERIEASLKKPTKTHEAEKHEMVLMHKCREALEADTPLLAVLTREERRQVSSFAFLTQKPIVAVRNLSDDQVAKNIDWNVPHAKETVSIGAQIEAELAGLEPEDRIAFMTDLGLEIPAREKMIQACYRAGGMISFLTVGADEVRAWTIREGDSAVEAASKIHTDLARGFIRAETVAYDDLVGNTDMKGAKAAGKVRKEGKTYIVQDGDILNILANP